MRGVNPYPRCSGRYMSSVNRPTKGACRVYEVCEALPGGPGEVYEGCELPGACRGI